VAHLEQLLVVRRITFACSRYSRAFASISSSDRIGRSLERPEGSPIRVV
jgi:hypothetical protein